MKTKAEIVQRLLDERKITAEEAVVLLSGDSVIEFKSKTGCQVEWNQHLPSPFSRLTGGDYSRGKIYCEL